MGSALLVAVLAASPARVATAEWVFSGVEKAVGDAFLDRFASKLAENGLRVTTQRDIAQVIGLQRQKQLSGCEGDSATSCLAELAGALGVDAVLAGSVVKVGSQFTVTLRAIGSGTGQELASASERLKNEDAVQDWLDVQAEKLAVKITAALRPEPTPPAELAAGPRQPLAPWLTVAGGGVLIVGAVICTALAASAAGWLGSSTTGDAGAIHAMRVQGESMQWTSVGLYAAGGIAVAAGLVWGLLTKSTSAVALAPLPSGGAWAGWSVALP